MQTGVPVSSSWEQGVCLPSSRSSACCPGHPRNLISRTQRLECLEGRLSRLPVAQGGEGRTSTGAAERLVSSASRHRRLDGAQNERCWRAAAHRAPHAAAAALCCCRCCRRAAATLLSNWRATCRHHFFGGLRFPRVDCFRLGGLLCFNGRRGTTPPRPLARCSASSAPPLLRPPLRPARAVSRPPPRSGSSSQRQKALSSLCGRAAVYPRRHGSRGEERVWCGLDAKGLWERREEQTATGPVAPALADTPPLLPLSPNQNNNKPQIPCVSVNITAPPLRAPRSWALCVCEDRPNRPTDRPPRA